MSDLLNRLNHSNKTRQEAIIQHVLALLNTRRGSLIHMPDYGLPEFNSHKGFHQAKKEFINALKNTIERFEPRMQVLFVEEVGTQRNDCVLQIKLHARLTQAESLSLDALLLSGGEVLVRSKT